MPGMGGLEGDPAAAAIAARRPRSSRSPPAAWPRPRARRTRPASDAFVRKPYREGELLAASASGSASATSTAAPAARPAGRRAIARAPTAPALSQRLRSLPPALIDQLREAAIEGRAGRLESLADQVRAALAKTSRPRFRSLARDFQYDTLVSALQSRSRDDALSRRTAQRQRAGRRRHDREPAAPVEPARRARLRGARGDQRTAGAAGRGARPARSHSARHHACRRWTATRSAGASRRGSGSKDVPVIFLTALTDTADKVLAFDAGGVDYVTKPFQFEEVLARVRAHVALSRAQLGAGGELRSACAPSSSCATISCTWSSTTCGRRCTAMLHQSRIC